VVLVHIKFNCIGRKKGGGTPGKRRAGKGLPFSKAKP